MARIFVDCHACACLLHIEDAGCPFCGALLRRTGAPLWLVVSLVGGLGLADVACDDHGDDEQVRLREQFGTSSTGTGSGTDTPGTSTSTSTGSTGTATTLDESSSSSSPDGSTYAGPDESASLDYTSGPGPGGATTTDDSPLPDGATYAGPDENSASLAEAVPSSDASDTSPTSADSDDSSGVMEAPVSEKDGCACDSRGRSPGGVLALLGLLMLRRRRSRRAY